MKSFIVDSNFIRFLKITDRLSTMLSWWVPSTGANVQEDSAISRFAVSSLLFCSRMLMLPFYRLLSILLRIPSPVLILSSSATHSKAKFMSCFNFRSLLDSTVIDLWLPMHYVGILSSVFDPLSSTFCGFWVLLGLSIWVVSSNPPPDCPPTWDDVRFKLLRGLSNVRQFRGLHIILRAIGWSAINFSKMGSTNGASERKSLQPHGVIAPNSSWAQ